MDQEKVKAVLEWEKPKTLKALRGFLSLTGWYNILLKIMVRLQSL